MDPDPGYYQNLAPPPHRQRFGSQTSLTSGGGGGAPPLPQMRDRPVSAHFPPPAATAANRQIISPGPEKPQRQYSYESDSGMGGGREPVSRPNNNEVQGRTSVNRVRFQDPDQV